MARKVASASAEGGAGKVLRLKPQLLFRTPPAGSYPHRPAAVFAIGTGLQARLNRGRKSLAGGAGSPCTQPMILERLPEVKNLSPEEKEILADELWADLGHSNHEDPDIKSLLERLLEQRAADGVIPWETLNNRSVWRSEFPYRVSRRGGG